MTFASFEFPLRLDCAAQLALKAVQVSDAKIFFDVISANQTHFAEYEFTAPQFSSVLETALALEQLEQRRIDRDGCYYGIWEADRLRGLITINQIDWDTYSADIGYWLALDGLGRGLARLALARLVQFCREELQLSFVQAFTAASNLRSQNLLTKTDFVFFKRHSARTVIRGKSVDDLEFRLVI